MTTTHGGGAGGYKNIVLAPASVQETFDLVQTAFFLADKYRNPVIVLSDAILGQMAEPLEKRTLEFEPLPEKDWAVRGRGRHGDGKRRSISIGQGFMPNPMYPTYLSFMESLEAKFRRMKEAEIRYETYLTGDADLILIAYGSSARVSQGAANMARVAGLKVGLVRLIRMSTLPWRNGHRCTFWGCWPVTSPGRWG
jgi:pyruvate/2-oxoacid:ferredoxin oxidoreductase alpha subunit